MSDGDGVQEGQPLEYVEGDGPGVRELPQLTVEDLAQAQQQAAGQPAAPEYPGWELEHIETFLLGAGSGIHLLIGVGERDWEMTKADLERIAPPMQRIANRWQPALRASAYADPFMVAYGVTLWAWRSALERARALKDLEAAQQEQGGARYERTSSTPEEPEEPDDQTDQQMGVPGAPFQTPGALFPQAVRPRYRT